MNIKKNKNDFYIELVELEKCVDLNNRFNLCTGSKSGVNLFLEKRLGSVRGGFGDQLKYLNVKLIIRFPKLRNVFKLLKFEATVHYKEHLEKLDNLELFVLWRQAD
jgi:hypothetical protein